MNEYDETNHSTDEYRSTDFIRGQLDAIAQSQREALAQRAAQLAAAQNAALGIIGTAQAAGEFTFNTGGQERFRIDASGHFGIGSTIQTHPIQRDINHPCWQATISEITDLWLARFGDKWVPYDEIRNDNDDAFLIIFTRLIALNKLESHQLNQPNLSRPITVLRLIS